MSSIRRHLKFIKTFIDFDCTYTFNKLKVDMLVYLCITADFLSFPIIFMFRIFILCLTFINLEFINSFIIDASRDGLLS